MRSYSVFLFLFCFSLCCYCAVPKTQIYYQKQLLLPQNHFYHLRMETGTKYWSAGLKCWD